MLYPQDEEQTLTSARKLNLHFYATFLTCYLCDNDLSNAKYLWKRAPANLKVPSSGAMLAEMWEVGKLLWKDDLAAALAQLTSVNWPEELRSVVLGLRDSIVSRHLAAVAQAYDQIPTTTVAQQLGLTTQYIIDCKCSQFMVS
jgi:COP9 signalosome complex subunit 8